MKQSLSMIIALVILASQVFAASVPISTAPDAGTLTGAERIPIGRGDNKPYSTTVHKIRNGESVVAGGTCISEYTINPTSGGMFTLTLNGACQIGAASLSAGQSFVLYLSQSATTAPTFSSAFKWPGGVTPTWSTSAGKYDTISCASPDGVKLICGAIIDAR
jgi:hypothetical protein